MARRKKDKTSFLSKLVFTAFGVFAVWQIIGFQVEIAAQETYLEKLREQLKEQQVANKEIERLLELGDDEEYLERIAQEKLGYAYSDETIYIDISGS